MRQRKTQMQRGQVLLEYGLILTVVIIPLALLIRGLLSDSSEAEKNNVVRTIVSDSYGDEDRMGIIGRPYP